MESVHWKVEGMTCSNCALSISKFLEKKGLQSVKVNPIDGDVSFDTVEAFEPEPIRKGIEELGYQVVSTTDAQTANTGKKMNRFLRYMLICAPFTLVLMLHMFHNIWPMHWLMNGWVQFALCLPVYIVGMKFFGVSAWKSLKHGMPNMNVLVAIGATAAFFYSLTGTILQLGEGYLFYETAAAIITLVFLGNYLEDVTIESTQRALHQLARSQKVMANMIAFDDQHQEVIFPLENTQLKPGDLVLIKNGEQVPADCKILWGEASANEAIITGESIPVEKQAKDKLIGGSLLVAGTVKAQVTNGVADSTLSNIINLVKKAQGDKPPMQLLADKISAIFVPIVLAVALLTFLGNWWYLQAAGPALLRSVAVLVIACPCAMGLATPAAIAVGLGRAARNGVLFRDARSLESFNLVKQVIFDKTGTLTTGKFTISNYQSSIAEDEFKRIVYSLEKYSNHPIAQSITSQWKMKNEIRWRSIKEVRGKGIEATDMDGRNYFIGGNAPAGEQNAHMLYLYQDATTLGWIDMTDELRPEAKSIIAHFKSKGLKTILLSGDKKDKTEAVAKTLGIDEVIAEQTPEQKLEVVDRLNKLSPVLMVGDGINDAPALAKATIGISLSDASQLAMQTASVVLVNHGLKKLPLSLGLGKHTFMTIRQNLFWAFFYNIIAIPLAAFGS